MSRCRCAWLTFELVQDLQDDVTSSVLLVFSFDEQLTKSSYSSIFDAGNSLIEVTELANDFALLMFVLLNLCSQVHYDYV